jgi:hypothetical protein
MKKSPASGLMAADLNDDDRAALVSLLRDTIAADRFAHSPRIRRLRAILAKLEPSKPRPAPLPPLKPSGEPSMVVARMRNSKRRR